jgi:oligoendopeptidase F
MKQRQRAVFTTCCVLIVFILATVVSDIFAQAAKQRSEINAKDKWKLEDMFASDAAWEQQYSALEANIPRMDVFNGKLGTSAQTLLQCLELYDSLKVIDDQLVVYSGLKRDEDARISKYAEMVDRITALESRLNEASSFIEPELLSIDSAKLFGFMKNEPRLKKYQFYFESTFRTKQHILSDREEAILAKATPLTSSLEAIFNLIDNADISFGTIKDDNGNDVQLTRERYSLILDGNNRRMRRDASNLYGRTYWKYMNGLSGTLSASVKKDYFIATSRNYPTCLDWKLDENNIPTSVFHNIIAAANANLAPLHKWAKIRKRILGLDTLKSYDLYASLLKEEPRSFTYEEAKKMLQIALAPLGKTYLTDMQKGFDSGWIDVYETEAKQTGAYNWGTYISHPYVLMNYNGSLDNVLTLGHEMGHAMHAYYTNRNEPYIYSDHSLFTAEVASTCNEAIMMKYLIAHAKDKQEKMFLLNNYIQQIISTVYTQLWFSEFELAIHEQIEKGGALSTDYFRKTYRDIYQKYWGPELVLDSLNEIGGIRIPHFYRAYYVYQYAVGYVAAQALSQKIINNEKGALEAYQRFLSTGQSKYPIDILKDAGVDLTTPDPVARTIQLFGELVDEMEKLLNEK